MAPYFPLYVSRSDGKLETVDKTKRTEPNCPTDDQLEGRQDGKGNSDYYKELELGDAREVDWRRKLGGMLIREIGGKEHPGNNYILAALPENYRLYERVKASGGVESADPYLYGHPQGRKKRYRTPGDFFPHVLWLATDETGDPDNCSCKICAPEDLQLFDKVEKTKQLPPEPVKKEAVPLRKDSVTSNSPNVITHPVVVVPPKKPPPQEKPAANTKLPVSRPPPQPAVAPPVQRQADPGMSATPLAEPRCLEQDIDSQYNKYLFRPGELTWFNRGAAWGLSVILKRTLTRNNPHNHDRPKYLVQPLSHPFSHPRPKIIDSEDLLRPWLAWSPPSPTHPGLTQMAGVNYNVIDWKGVLDGRFGGGDIEVDGSIFAAKTVDDSFALFDPLANNTVTTGERIYNGLYFGGEKIWVGEPVRLRTGGSNAGVSGGQVHDVLVVHQIIERLKQNSTSTSSAAIFFVGDIYKFVTVPVGTAEADAAAVAASSSSNRHIPIRLRQDVEYRNRATVPAKRTLSYWKLVQPAARLPITDVKGRWYESSVLLPVLKGAVDFTSDYRRGDIGEVGQWMNARGDCLHSTGKLGTRVGERLAAFGKSVPPGTRISKGLDGGEEDRKFPGEAEVTAPLVQQPRPAVHAQHRQGQGQVEVKGEVEEDRKDVVGVSDGDIAEFVNLDRMEEGYVQNFAEAAGTGFRFDGSQR
ncbi:MAG: hypothetical protein LQ342_004998 [Letrouitia transgressa]|nr:MAG: hypothetical protein LQ342_004998 [Letrouitia transgressa]